MIDLNKLIKNNYGGYWIYGFIETESNFKDIDLKKLFKKTYPPELKGYNIWKYHASAILLEPNGLVVPIVYDCGGYEQDLIERNEGAYKALKTFDAIPVHDYYNFGTFYTREVPDKMYEKIDSLINIVNDFWNTEEEAQSIVRYVNEILLKED